MVWPTSSWCQSKRQREERRFGLVGVWVHPNQACLLSLEEAARKLTLLINMKKGWHYAFVHICEDLQHIPHSWCWTHQCLGRQGTWQKCLWVTQPTGGLPTPSFGWWGGIPRGPELRFEPVWVTLLNYQLGSRIHWQGHSIADNSSQNHSGWFSESHSSMVIKCQSLPCTLLECPSERATSPSKTEE